MRPGPTWFAFTASRAATGASRRLADAIRSRRIEVLHAHQYSPFFYAALALPLCGFRPRLILTEHGRHYPDRVSPLRRAVNRLVLDHLADEVTACCHFSAEGLARTDGFAGARIEVIENGIEVDRYEPASDKHRAKVNAGLDPSRQHIIHVARHHPVKDQAMLLRAFALAASDLPTVDLLLVGDGPLRKELENQAVELRIVERVKFLGIRSDIPALMQAADVFALTSLTEAASLTLLEAMASGLPVVVTDVGGNPEIVRHDRDGLLVPRGDAIACAEAFRRLFADPARASQFGAAGRTRVREGYCLSRTVDRYYRLYCRLAGKKWRS